MTEPGAHEGSGETPEPTFPEVLDNLSLGPGRGHRRRRRRDEEPADEAAPEQEQQAAPDQAQRQPPGSSDQPPGSSDQPPGSSDQPPGSPAEQPVSLFGPTPEPPLGGGDDTEPVDGPASGVSSGPSESPDTAGPAEDGDEAAAVRPYAWTRGRTRPVHDLAVETLVSTSEHGHDVAALASTEHRTVAELCRSPRSVAEVAALLSLPLGVTKVLLADMTDIGLVVVHATASDSGDAPDRALMERVLSGLRRL